MIDCVVRNPLFHRIERGFLAVAIATLGLAWGSPVAAATFDVTTTLDRPDDNPGDGVCATLMVVGPPIGIPPLPQLDFRCTLRGAIQEANLLPGMDEVVLPAGTFSVTSLPAASDDDIAVVGDLDLLDDIQIRGAGSAATTIDVSDGDGFQQIAIDCVVELEGFSLQGPLSGSAINSEPNCHWTPTMNSCSLDLDDIVIRGWDTTVSVWTLSARDSRFQDSEGGPFASVLDLDSVYVSTTDGAGGSSVAVRDSMFDDCWTGLRIDTGSVEGSTFYANRTGLSTYLNARVTNSTFSENETGIDTTESGDSLILEHVTIVDSSIRGIRTEQIQDVRLDHTFIAGNARDCDLEINPLAASRYSFDSDGTCGMADPTDLPSSLPLVLALADNGGPTMTHALATASPARNGGANTCVVAEDQRGRLRPRGSACDIGAFEAATTGGASCGLGFEVVPLLVGLRVLRGRTRLRRPRCDGRSSKEPGSVASAFDKENPLFRSK